jgi:dienelactone hydrolase
MMNSITKKIAVGTSTFLLSMSVLATTPSPEPEPEPTPPSCEVDCDFTRGPDPTESYLEAESGPYSVSTKYVSYYEAPGFGGGTIHYPTNTTGEMGVIAIVPGFLAYESSIAWWGPRLASHGFIVITISTNNSLDDPSSRATQQENALNYVINQSNDINSPIYEMVDSTRLGGMGWSMGGGGTLETATGSRLSAAIPLAPWYSSNNDFNQIETPTMIVACEYDGVAGVDYHASPFYESIPTTTDKAYLEVSGGYHSCANGGGTNGGLLGKYGVAWMKLFIDNDARYDQFLCGPDHAGNSAISEYRDTCNY